MKLYYHAESDSAMLDAADWVDQCEPIDAHKLPHGTVIGNVGLGVSTVIADLDFETYSEAGYVFDEVKKKWRKSTGAPKGAQSGLGVVGVVNYVSHPTAEILSMAYDLKDGKGSRLWFPGIPFPQDLLDYVARGGLIGAWNANFEFWAWEVLCHKGMGWPKLPFWNLRCDMAKAMAHGLPGKLEHAGDAIGSAVRKGADGKRLLNKFSIPQNPLKACPDRRRTFIKDEPVDGPKLYEYNIGDIQTESAISALVPDLSPYELAIWKYDQAINVRGVQIDMDAVRDFISIVYQSQDMYRRELVAITDGAVESEGQTKKMKEWAEGYGIYWSTIDKDNIDSVIDTCPAHQGSNLNPVRRVLEIRKILGSAAVKKLFAMDLKASAAGRMHGVFSYCGAQKTGRWAGRDVQPQNMPAKGLKVAICNCCGGIVWAKAKNCFHCGDFVQGFTDLRPDGTKVEWDEDGVEAVIKCAQNRDLELFVQHWGNAYDAISACLRGLLSAAPGFDLICSDFSAIEAVVLAFAAQCQWRMDVFNTHGKIYEQSAANIAGIPFEEMMAHAGYHDLGAAEWWSTKATGPHHPLRKTLGKVCELACFGADTKILTGSGWKRIVDVTTADRLHDGVEFVSHDGVVPRGSRLTTTLDGVTVTPDHKFYTGRNQWKTTDDLKASSQDLNRARDTARSLLSSCEQNRAPGGSWLSSALVNVDMSETSTSQTYGWVSLRGATLAPSAKALKRQLDMIRDAKTRQNDVDSLIESPPQSVGALIRSINSSPRTVGEVSESTRHGLKTKTFGSRTSAHLTGVTTPTRPSTGATTIEDTSPETCVLSRTSNNKATSDRPSGSSSMASKCPRRSSTDDTRQTMHMPTPSLESCETVKAPRVSSSNQTREVFDVINCGPRSRFVILTEKGPLIAHNSGYQGWIGAWKNFGADKFMTDDEIKKAILKWRDASPEIVEFWGGQYRQVGYRQIRTEYYGVEGCAVAAILNPGTVYKYTCLEFGVKDDILYIKLPSGRSLTYHTPRLLESSDPLGNPIKQITFMGVHPTTKKWVLRDTYGGRLTENIIQGIARDIQANSIANVENGGYSVVLHVHDEIISEVREGSGSIEEFERLMSTMPAWCADWPVKAKGGWRGKRYKKD